MFRGIFFDGNGTLVDNSWQDAVDAQIMARLRTFGGFADKEFYAALTKLAGEYDAKNRMGYKTGLEFLVKNIPKELNLGLNAAQATNLYQMVEDYRRKNVKLYDNAQKLLKELAGEYKLSLISDDTFSEVRESLHEFGVLDMFSHVFMTAELDADKESGSVFSLALSRTGLRAEECLMVGDSIEKDGKCRTLGIKFCLVVRKAREYDSSTYDFKIETLNELPKIVGSDIL